MISLVKNICQKLNGKMAIHLKSVGVKNIVMGRVLIREDLLNVVMMKVLQQEKCLMNVNFQCRLLFT